MPKAQYFNNRRIIEPGAAARVLGGVEKAPDTLSNGKVLLLDLGLGASFGGGSGINGEKFSGKEAIYRFTDIQDFREWMRGSQHYEVARRIFSPSKNPQIRGAEEIIFVSAKTSAAAELDITWTGGGANGGNLLVKAFAEGVGANGVEDTVNVLTKGFGAVMIAGVVDTSKFIMQFYVGEYKGTDPNGDVIDKTAAASINPTLLVESPEFDNVQELIDWMAEDSTFGEYFYDSGTAVAGTGVVDAADLAATSGNQLFAGGTESYNAADIDSALEAVEDLDYTFIVCDKYGITDGKGTEVGKIITHILTDAKYQKHLVIGGGQDDTEWNQAGASSIDLAETHDNGQIFVVHSDIYENDSRKAIGYRQLTTFYHAATVAGRMAGAEPQEPLTWKDIDIDGVAHMLTKSERETLLQSGVMHIRDVDGELVINQEVTTLQDNNQLIYPDGQSPEGSVMRISSLLNKTIEKNLEKRFVGQNLYTASAADVKSYVQRILLDNTASENEDGMLLSTQDIKVTFSGTDYNISYGFVPNGPVNRLFVTGFAFTPKLNA